MMRPPNRMRRRAGMRLSTVPWSNRVPPNASMA